MWIIRYLFTLKIIFDKKFLLIKMYAFISFFFPSFSDLYQITMAYAYWKAGRTKDQAIFDLFFRKSPFSGEFTIFAGLSECLKFLENFKYSESDIEYLKKTLPSNVEPDFYTYLANLTPKDIKIHALQEGSIAFPRWVFENDFLGKSV